MGRARLGLILMAVGVAVVGLGIAGLAGSSDGGVSQGAYPERSGSISPSETPSASPSPSPSPSPSIEVETPEAFLALFGAAIRDGDAAFLFDRLHPVVIDSYGAGECRTFVGSFVDPEADFGFVSASGLGEYLWEVDGRSTPVRDVLTVEVMQTSQGESSRREIHLGIVGSELRWFTDCGELA